MKPRTFLNILLISLVPVFVLYIPFALGLKKFFFLTIEEPGFVNILRNWDGPHYIVVAHSFYNLKETARYLFTSVPPIYYTAHFPLYPILIALIAPLLGYFYGALLINLFFGVALNILFYVVAKKYTKHPMFLTFVFTVFPGRFLVTRAIAAPETLMVFLMFLALVLWEDKKFLPASISASLGILSKVKSGFLFPAFFLQKLEEYLLAKKKTFDPKSLTMFLIPLTLLGLFSFYYIQTGNFFAFFEAEHGNDLFVTFPFAQFDSTAAWVGTAWVEDVVFYFGAMFLLAVTLFFKKENRSWFYYVALYSLFLVFVPQRDITRFSYPMYPIFLLTFEKFFTRKEFRYALILLLPAIYFYAWNFMLQNQAPIANFAPFL